MTLDKARETVHRACAELVKAGLVARTWGNISAKVDDSTFVITPSGRRYEELTAADMVLVKISDLSYGGSVKPSSEKGLHAEIYRQYPEVNAIIHTHQMNASTVAAARKDITGMDPRHSAILGSIVRTAEYGLPGTGKLARATAFALKGSKAAMMANHGAVCAGRDMKEAFIVAGTLEDAARSFIEKAFIRMSGSGIKVTEKAMHDYYLKLVAER
ncbi:MAG TPA: class II aldolase/adducin family protein [Spirochaetota bacterium]|nr:class II aldolase/adducin family protein [Spirochaetota bacterium]